jgi:hypothetical protein
VRPYARGRTDAEHRAASKQGVNAPVSNPVLLGFPCRKPSRTMRSRQGTRPVARLSALRVRNGGTQGAISAVFLTRVKSTLEAVREAIRDPPPHRGWSLHWGMARLR